MVRLDQIQSAFLIDDGSDWPLGDRSWQTTLDDYAGISLDDYRSMAMWANENWAEWPASESSRSSALALVENGGFLRRPCELHMLLRNTVIHFTDGTKTSFRAERKSLAELVDIIHDDNAEMVPLRYIDDDFERFINPIRVRAIDVPMIEIIAAYAD